MVGAGCRYDDNLGRRRSHALFADTRGIDVAGRVDVERGNLFFRRAIENERLAGRRDAVDQPASVGAGNQVAPRIEMQDADVGFVALEKQRMFARFLDPENLPLVTGGDIDPPLRVLGQVPDVLGFRIEEDRGGVARVHRKLRCLRRRGGCVGFRCRRGARRCAVHNLVHLPVGRGSGVNRPARIHHQCLHLQFLRLKDDAGLAGGRHAIHPSRRARSRVDVALRVSGDRPHIG